MAQYNRVVCVLSESQREEYKAELDGLKQSGIELVFETSPESVASTVSRINPSVVIFGTQVEEFEGIEIMSMLMQKHKGFARPIVILPEKEDGLAPMIHTRSASTGKSEMESAGFDRIGELAKTPPRDALIVPVEASPETAARGAPVQPIAEPADVISPSQILKPALADMDAAQARAPGPASRGKGKLIGAVAGVAVIAVVVAAVVLTGGDKGSENQSTAANTAVRTASRAPQAPAANPGPSAAEQAAEASDPPEKTEKQAEPPEKTPAVEEQSPEKAESEPASPEVQPREEPLPELSLEPEDLMAALTFEQSQGYPNITDRQKLDSIVAALKNRPDVRIVLTGHASSEGADVDNYDLALIRAKRVRDILVERGLSESRFETRSLGEKKPIDTNETEQGRKRNRRVTIKLVP